MPRPTDHDFERVISNVASQLCSVEHLAAGAFVRVPLLYPSGSYVVVRVQQEQRAFLVSDYGLGYQEAELIGASSTYVRLGRVIADNAGVGFDHHAFFVLNASAEQLASAIATIGSCSLEAVALAAHRAAERKAAADAERLYDRLLNIFPARSVTKDASIVGESNTDWHVATVVKPVRGRPTIFETVTAHRNSVSAATTKFLDISRLVKPPHRVAVVHSKREMGTLLGVLSDVASVIEESAPDSQIRTLAEAA